MDAEKVHNVGAVVRQDDGKPPHRDRRARTSGRLGTSPVTRYHAHNTPTMNHHQQRQPSVAPVGQKSSSTDDSRHHAHFPNPTPYTKYTNFAQHVTAAPVSSITTRLRRPSALTPPPAGRSRHTPPPTKPAVSCAVPSKQGKTSTLAIQAWCVPGGAGEAWSVDSHENRLFKYGAVDLVNMLDTGAVLSTTLFGSSPQKKNGVRTKKKNSLVSDGTKHLRPPPPFQFPRGGFFAERHQRVQQ